ncbi:MAG: DUF1961 family protein, partial [Planctomycetes bacterium]|nr:DUF1961 family protein [Planctomycetota bacterium]
TGCSALTSRAVLTTAMAVAAVATITMVGCRPVAAPQPTEKGSAVTETLFFEETWDSDLSNWRAEGQNLVEVTGGRLHVKTARGAEGQFVWLTKDLPADFRVEYDLTPASASGFFLIFFCARGVDGEDILSDKLFRQYKRLRDFKKYTIGPVNCYHISYRRNRQANCNLRKNTGKKLLKQSRLDALLPEGRTAHIMLTKQDGRIRLVVDGREFMDYTDNGTSSGEVYGPGKIGLRQVYDSEGYYDNFKVFSLSP